MRPAPRPTRRTVLAGLALLAGCTERTARETSEPPTYATCDGARTPAGVPPSAAAIPDPLTEASVADYLAALERAIVRPEDATAASVVVGEVGVEPVEHGFLGRVHVTGGYYNEERSGSTETVHVDLAPHTGNYVVTERVVRRIEDGNGAVDPRERGDVIVCDAE